MSPLNEQLRALQAMLSARDTARAARADFHEAFNAAREAGVSDATLSDELYRDSVAHGDVDLLLSLVRELPALAWEDERCPAGPDGGYRREA